MTIPSFNYWQDFFQITYRIEACISIEMDKLNLTTTHTMEEYDNSKAITEEVDFLERKKS